MDLQENNKWNIELLFQYIKKYYLYKSCKYCRQLSDESSYYHLFTAHYIPAEY
ncbi:hypothetical protein MCY_00801 [Bartonella rattimassiliensis 15908]|uniref:Uncharacterized protein n=1 Tax=Bartonella rattimassiliensis 15908 TaxID=1094556 RepID=J1JN21_9HYPH|nr:hypothetical protein MCY_00801 [Bartonella rattimassiliensis 15908]